MAARKRKLIVKIAVSVVIVVVVTLGGLYLYSFSQMSKIPSMSFEDMLHYTTEKNKNVLITVGILKDGEAAYTVYGTNGTVLPQEEYDYEIGSLTKTFTTSLVCKAIQEGKIDLDAQINQYLSLPSKGYYPTLKRLVTHTSGYREYYLDWQMVANFLNGQDNDYYGITFESLNKKVSKINLEDKDHPFRYSNFGIAVVGEVLAKVYGQDYRPLMNKFIENEFHLKDTRISDGTGNLSGYWNWQTNDAYLPAGAIVSNITDMMRYCELHMTDALAYLVRGHEVIADANATTKSLQTLGIRMDAVGIGWMIDEENGLIWHNGGTSNFNSYLAFDKRRRIGVVTLSNLPPDYRIPATVMGSKLIRVLQEEYDQHHDPTGVSEAH